jgi:hypothetical protein
MSEKKMSEKKIILYKQNLLMQFENRTVWATQKQMAEIYGVSTAAINQHLKSLIKAGEVDKGTIKKNLIVQNEGMRKVKRVVDHYDLKIVISVGFKVENPMAIEFRKWARNIIEEYAIKGFALDDARLKELGGGSYFKELLERIRDIRSSEKALYRQVLDLYATSIDYNAKAPETLEFFKIVQNKLHYASSKQSAAEIIFERADAEKDFMGLTTFAGAMPIRSEVVIAKNYLSKDELFILNRLVGAFFDLAEIKAKQQKFMTMQKWVKELDNFVKSYGKGKLKGSGGISHKMALTKALNEYLKYQAKTLSPVEKEYIEAIKKLENKVNKE